MRAGRLFGIPVRISPAAFLFAGLAIWLGEGMRFAVMTGSVILHELMHIAAARMMHVRVIELELMPVGGAARMENLWGLRPGQMTAVALAGPLMNLLLATAAAALCWWGAIPAGWADVIIGQNMMIMLFNLLPALPMDGGRILCGLFTRRLSPAGAARMGSRLACVMAAVLCGVSAYGLAHGRLNITLPVAAAFLLISARREKLAAESASIISLMNRAGELAEERIMPMRWLAASSDATVREVSLQFRPRCMHMIEVYGERMEPQGMLSEEMIMHAMLDDSDVKLSDMHKNVNKKVF